MKTLIYQYWNGAMPSGAKASRENIQSYSKRVGAVYHFAENLNWSRVNPKYFDIFRPIYDEWFWRFDRVLFLDMDIFAVDGLEENIFDVPVSDIGLCEEPDQPEMRQRLRGHICGGNDERWASIVSGWGSAPPRDSMGRLRVFNTGVVMFTGRGMEKARREFIPFRDYVRSVKSLPAFYGIDQNYLHAMVFRPGISFTEMPVEWNRQVHYIGRRGTSNRPIYDKRTRNTKFVHVQVSGASGFNKSALWRIVNLPKEKWKCGQETAQQQKP